MDIGRAGPGDAAGGGDRPVDVASLIRVKRDNERPLTAEEIRWLFRAQATGDVADEQMAALLMAIYFNGLDGAELRAWTGAMIASGDRLDLDLSDISGTGGTVCVPAVPDGEPVPDGERLTIGRGVPGGEPRPVPVDKHSTGGVGDKVSLVLAPLVASCGAMVPMLSGRGLGHTGGTLDKLESIPRFRADLDNSKIRQILRDVGVVIAAAGPGLVPADRRLYALRDVTGTVESIPLIASSIMSKKIAEGTRALVLDVKTGSGAFMRDEGKAIELARVMTALGAEHGVATRALVTRMDTPLGRAVGNAVEVTEAIAALRGEGPDDLMEVTYALARHMLDLAGLDADPREAIDSGRAYDTFRKMVRAQGGDPDAPLPEAEHRERVLPAPRDGWVTGLDALKIGTAAWRLGAGRARKEDPVSATAGVRCLVKPGDFVRRGQETVEIAADATTRSEYAIEALEGALALGDRPRPGTPLVVREIT
ncbi:MAG: thymidine phosphorylase [Nocardiopsaceae bacterium]|nr:thymidine phosphorylase [Nocardiopsaceae bacterium]